MAERPQYSPRQLKLAQVFAAILLVLGLWHLLHGGLSLMGGFGFERHMTRELGHPTQSRGGMVVELLAGLAVMSCGLALYLAVKRSSGVDILAKVNPEKLPPGRRALNRLAISGAIIWIAYMIFVVAVG